MAAQARVTRPSVPEAVLEERPQCRESVAPRDLLALVELTPGVRDRYLVDPDAALENLRGDLGFDVETIRLELHVVDEIAIEQLVARLHVGERRVEQHVRR